MSYSTVSLPKELHERIQRAIEAHPEWAFSSVAEFVRSAIRAYSYYDRILEMPMPEENPEEKQE